LGKGFWRSAIINKHCFEEDAIAAVLDFDFGLRLLYLEEGRNGIRHLRLCLILSVSVSLLSLFWCSYVILRKWEIGRQIVVAREDLMTPNGIANSKQTMTSRWSSLLRYFSSTRGSSGPVAIRVGYAPGAGRGVFAVRDIAVGDLIHTADPVVAHPALASLQKVGSTSSPELQGWLHVCYVAMTSDFFLLLLGTCRLATIACKGSKSNRRLEDFFLSQWDLQTLPESWANWVQMMRLDMPASFAVWAVKIQQPRLYTKFLLQSWKTFSSFLECRRKFGSNYMRELLGMLPVHSHWALLVSQCRSSTALRSKQIGHNCMHTAG
jgi:hypothetical protein